MTGLERDLHAYAGRAVAALEKIAEAAAEAAKALEHNCAAAPNIEPPCPECGISRDTIAAFIAANQEIVRQMKAGTEPASGEQGRPLVGALLWLRNHLDVGKPELRPIVLATIDDVLAGQKVSAADSQGIPLRALPAEDVVSGRSVRESFANAIERLALAGARGASINETTPRRGGLRGHVVRCLVDDGVAEWIEVGRRARLSRSLLDHSADLP